MPKQLEKKKTQTKDKPSVSKNQQQDIGNSDLFQVVAEEGAQSRLFNDPRLQYDNAGDLRLHALQMMQQHGGNTQVQRMLQQGSESPGEASLIQREDTESFPVLSWLDRQRHNLMEATGLESAEEAERGRATAFYAHGMYGP